MKPARQQDRDAMAGVSERPTSVVEWRYVADGLPEEGVCVLVAPHWEPGVWSGTRWHEPISSLNSRFRYLHGVYAWADWPTPPPKREG